MGVDRGERGGLSVFNLSLYLVQETPAGVERSPTTSEAKLRRPNNFIHCSGLVVRSMSIKRSGFDLEFG